MNIQSLTFITGNKGKAEQLQRLLNFPVDHRRIDLPEIQSLDLQEIVEKKACAAYEIMQKPIIVEDTSLTFSVLNNLPGPFIKWFLQEIGNQGMVDLLKNHSDHSAVAQVTVGLFDGKELQMFDGITLGSIATEPRGEKGFGWDPIFIPEGHSQTWGEMTSDERNDTSMRKKALKKLEEYLKR